MLVNHKTADAAEALAAVLRQDARALILGSTTAGEATIGKDFPLKNGQYLRIATAGVKLGNGTSLSATGLKPDISITLDPEEEQAYFANPSRLQPRRRMRRQAWATQTACPRDETRARI